MNPEGEATSLEVRPGVGSRGGWDLDEDGDWQGGMEGLRPLGLACHLTSSHLVCPHHRSSGGFTLHRSLTGEGSRELRGHIGVLSLEEGINARQGKWVGGMGFVPTRTSAGVQNHLYSLPLDLP